MDRWLRKADLHAQVLHEELGGRGEERGPAQPWSSGRVSRTPTKGKRLHTNITKTCVEYTHVLPGTRECCHMTCNQVYKEMDLQMLLESWVRWGGFPMLDWRFQDSACERQQAS